MRNPKHLDLDGNRYLLFHFFGGMPGPLADDVHVIVGDVWIDLDGHVMERHRPPQKQQHPNRQHHIPVIESKIYKIANHRFFLEPRRRASFIVDHILEIDGV